MLSDQPVVEVGQHLVAVVAAEHGEHRGDVGVGERRMDVSHPRLDGGGAQPPVLQHAVAVADDEPELLGEALAGQWGGVLRDRSE